MQQHISSSERGGSGSRDIQVEGKPMFNYNEKENPVMYQFLGNLTGKEKGDLYLYTAPNPKGRQSVRFRYGNEPEAFETMPIEPHGLPTKFVNDQNEKRTKGGEEHPLITAFKIARERGLIKPEPSLPQ